MQWRNCCSEVQEYDDNFGGRRDGVCEDDDSERWHYAFGLEMLEGGKVWYIAEIDVPVSG